jgi:nucleotide-binding universal stress UspA family protein
MERRQALVDFKKILFPVDLSETSPQLVSCVTMMAEKFDAQIHLLFVARVFEYFTSIYVPHPTVDRFERDVVAGATQRLEEFRQEFFKDYPATRAQVVSGDICEQILGYALAEKIDLIIMGTHGRKGIDKIVFGSVAERISKSAVIPVLLVKPFKTDATA